MGLIDAADLESLWMVFVGVLAAFLAAPPPEGGAAPEEIAAEPSVCRCPARTVTMRRIPGTRSPALFPICDHCGLLALRRGTRVDFIIRRLSDAHAELVELRERLDVLEELQSGRTRRSRGLLRLVRG
jgi:hypothetical protein